VRGSTTGVAPSARADVAAVADTVATDAATNAKSTAVRVRPRHVTPER
jgi:hypothetical protein